MIKYIEIGQDDKGEFIKLYCSSKDLRQLLDVFGQVMGYSNQLTSFAAQIKKGIEAVKAVKK